MIDNKKLRVNYFKNKLLKSFDFTLGFCMPKSRNCWEVIYTLPDLDPALEAEMVAAPYETKSDSFYFVGGKMVMPGRYHGGCVPDSVLARARAPGSCARRPHSRQSGLVSYSCPMRWRDQMMEERHGGAVGEPAGRLQLG